MLSLAVLIRAAAWAGFRLSGAAGGGTGLDRPGVPAPFGIRFGTSDVPIVRKSLLVIAGALRRTGKTRSFTLLRRPGDISEVAAPDPIPNSVVKRLSADGTASMVAGE